MYSHSDIKKVFYNIYIHFDSVRALLLKKKKVVPKGQKEREKKSPSPLPIFIRSRKTEKTSFTFAHLLSFIELHLFFPTSLVPLFRCLKVKTLPKFIHYSSNHWLFNKSHRFRHKFLCSKQDLVVAVSAVPLLASTNLLLQFFLQNYGIISGEVSKPTKQTSEKDEQFLDLLEDWESKSHQILTWIRNASISCFKIQFARVEIAKDVWDLLAKRYSTTNIIH